MTQIATVTALPDVPGGPVELTVKRQTACGHSCDGCGGCAGKSSELVVRAACGIPVALGDQVEVYSGNQVLGLAALVYALPIVLFLLGYLIPGNLAEPWRYACGGLGFLLGLGSSVVCDRGMKRKTSLPHRVTRKL